MSTKHVPRIAWIDGIKGIAIIGVILHHYSSFFPSLETITDNWVQLVFTVTPLRIIYNGPFWVYVFWFLSAYLIGYKFFSTGKTYPLIPSIIKRYVRLFMPVFVATAIASLCFHFSLMGHTFPTSFYNHIILNVTPSITNVLYTSGITTFFLGWNQYVITLWFLRIEFIGSVFLYVIIGFFGKRSWRYILYLCLLYPAFVYYYTPILLGFVLSDIEWNFGTLIRNIDHTPIPFFSLLAGVIAGSYPIGNLLAKLYSLYPFIEIGSEQTSIKLFYTVGSFLLVFSCMHIDLIKKKLSQKLWRIPSNYSLTLCSIHILVFYTISIWVYDALTPIMIYSEAVILMMLLSAGVIAGASYMFYRFVEMPGIKVSEYIYNYLAKIVYRI